MSERIPDREIIAPHLRVPLQFSPAPEGPRLQMVEQDSEEEIFQCVVAILSYRLGQRAELPEFGITEQALREGGADMAEIRQAINMWEPRADSLTDQELVNAIAYARVRVRPSTNG